MITYNSITSLLLYHSVLIKETFNVRHTNIRIYKISLQWSPTETTVKLNIIVCLCAGDPKDPVKPGAQCSVSVLALKGLLNSLHWKAGDDCQWEGASLKNRSESSFFVSPLPRSSNTLS